LSQTDIIQVQPVKLTQKFGRYTKGLMTSISIILVSTTLAIIGIQIGEDIIITVGFIVTGLSSIIFLVFFVLFLTSIRRLGRTNESYYSTVTRIFVMFFYGFIFAAAGGTNSYSDNRFHSEYFLSRVYGMIAIVLFGLAFIFINKLFKEFQQDKLYPVEEKKNLGLPIMMGAMLLVILIDTILRPVAYGSSMITMNYVILAIMFVLVSVLCYFLYKLGSDWLKIDDDLNNQYFKMGGKTFNDKFKSNILYISTIFIVSSVLSLIYVIYYFVIYTAGGYGYIEELIFSVGIFVGVMILFLVIYIIRISLNFNKMAQLNTKTSNQGIFTAISLSFSPFLLIAGFFSNIGFDTGDELYWIARILLLLGIVLFALGSYFNYVILKNLKLNKDGFEVRKKDLILPISGLVLFVLLLADTIIRFVVWEVVYDANSIGMDVFNLEFLWFGYLMGALFFLAIIPTIYGLITTSKEFLKVIPAYGKIPLRLRKSKVEEQLQLYQADQDMVPAAKAVAHVPDKPEAVQFCSSCGKELQARFNFCAFCGDKKDTKLKPCSNCGEVLEKGYKFCPICGKKK